jgi:hypothetical protein
MKFRKRPVVVEAVQLTWANWDKICEFVPTPWFVRGCYVDKDGHETLDTSLGRMGLVLRTLESQEFVAVEGDWIIKGVQGEFYPCKPDIFETIYELVE